MAIVSYYKYLEQQGVDIDALIEQQIKDFENPPELILLNNPPQEPVSKDYYDILASLPPESEQIETLRNDCNTIRKWMKTVKENPQWQLNPTEEREKIRVIINTRRMGQCGQIRLVLNPVMQQWEQKHWYCKIRGCPSCDAFKKKHLHKQVEKIKEENKEAVVFEIEEKERKKIVEKCGGKEKVKVIPLEGGKSLVIAEKVPEKEEEEKESRKVRKLKDFDIESIEPPPKGKKTSGNLGKEDEPEKIEFSGPDIVELSIANIIVEDLPYNKKQELMQESLDEFPEEEPKTVEELQSICYRVENSLRNLVEEAGGRILFLFREPVKVSMKNLNWSRRARQRKMSV